jgi:hypothetical protein
MHEGTLHPLTVVPPLSRRWWRRAPPRRSLRPADRLRRLAAGSVVADRFSHEIPGRTGPAPSDTPEEAAALAVLPDGVEADWQTTIAGETYAAIRRKGAAGRAALPAPRQWGATRALTLCGAAMRGHAWLAKPRA